MNIFVRIAVVLLGCVMVAGCGAKKVTVNGKVTRKGEPIKMGTNGYFQVTLIPVVEKGKNYTTIPGRSDADGAFVIENVPAGKYRIAIQQFDPNPQQDALGGQFSEEKTKIVRDIDGKSPIEIDLNKPE